MPAGVDRRAARARRRERIVVADDGLTLHHHGYTENIAHALLLALEQPEAAAGKIFNIGDEEVLSVRQVVEIIAAALGHRFEIVSMPYDLAVPARPLLAQPLPTHRVLDLTRVRTDLGYRDVVPAREALARTARWLADHPLARLDRGVHAHRSVRLRGRGPPRSTRGRRPAPPCPSFEYDPEPRYGPRVQRARRPRRGRERSSRPERPSGH